MIGSTIENGRWSHISKDLAIVSLMDGLSIVSPLFFIHQSMMRYKSNASPVTMQLMDGKRTAGTLTLGRDFRVAFLFLLP